MIEVVNVHVTIKFLCLFQCSQDHKVNMSHIESRPSKRSKTEYDFFVDCEELQGPKLEKFVDSLKVHALSITLHSDEGGGTYDTNLLTDFILMFMGEL